MVGARWSPDELDRIGASEELKITPVHGGERHGQTVPIWVVRVDDDLYVRSWRGSDGAWYRAVRESCAAHISAGGVEQDVELLDAAGRSDDAADVAYRQKYRRYPTYVEPMLGPQARATTLRLLPIRTGAT